MALSHLLRYSLMSNDEQVPLSREVRIVDEYYSIYHVRFGDRVKMEWRISDSLDLTETMVPSFILQPIVENAFKHGICPKEEGGVVRIRMNPLREKGLLCIRVWTTAWASSRSSCTAAPRWPSPGSAGSISAFIMWPPVCGFWINGGGWSSALTRGGGRPSVCICR